VLAANQAAMGGTPARGAAMFEYAYSGSGLVGVHIDQIDLATGAYVETEQSGAIGQADGYDGHIPWMRDVSGADTPEQGGDKIALAVNEAYRLAHAWWRPDRGGAAIAWRGRAVRDGRPMDHLLIKVPGGKPFDAWFDADSHLLAEVDEDAAFFHTRTLYADYRREGPVLAAHKITVDPGQGPLGYQVLSLSRITIGPPRPLADYACPTAPPTGARIESGAASVSLPFRFLNNHIYIQVSVNGQGPFTFIVDSGGHTLISPQLVQRLGLKSVGAFASSGAGEKTEVGGFVAVDDIALGDLHLRRQIGFAAQIYDPSIEGITVDGMVGFELIRRFATRIDYAGRTITFTDPARFEAADAGQPIPFVFYDHLPQIPGFIGEAPARLDIDTGSRSELDVTSPFVAAHSLRTALPPGVSAVTGWGVGGPARSYVTRLPALTLGTVTIEAPVADLSESRAGAFSDANFDGNVGSGLLKRFTVTFDYAHQRLYLKPAVPAPTDIADFDRSGLWFNARPEGYVITDVAKDSPAASAGLAVGDLIVSIDGQVLSPQALSEWRGRLRTLAPGTQLALRYRRAAAEASTTLTLRDQI
jgi:hypothetical protein